MESKAQTIANLQRELEEVRRQLYEANETIEAIRTGQVDALVVQSGSDHQLYSLRTADHTYRVFIEKMNEGAVTLNREGVILYANSQFAAMVGLPLSGVIGLPFVHFINNNDKTFYGTLFQTCWTEDCKGEVLLFGNGMFVPVQLSLNVLELEEAMSVSIIVTDLTMQKANQKLLEDNNRELELLNKTLEASNHDLQQFASVASHDLQEPLRKIQMFANLLQQNGRAGLGEEQIKYLEKIMGSAGRMKTLIIDVLNYSRLSSNEGRFAITDLNIVVKELLDDLEIVIKEKGALIQYADLPELEVNRGQIRQVFQNLISNALKFAKAGTAPAVQILSRYLDRKDFASKPRTSGPYCMITIKDNGIGFDEKYSPNIFSLFERLHSKDKYEGTGIGLAITKKIIEKHQGLIQVKSAVGIGSEFQFILPVRQEQKLVV